MPKTVMSSAQLDVVRRRFLGWVSGAGAFLAAHGFSIPDAAVPDSPIHATSDAHNRIRGLVLMTIAPLSQMKNFTIENSICRSSQSTPDDLRSAPAKVESLFGRLPTRSVNSLSRESVGP
jgi:hypothetical protein